MSSILSRNAALRGLLDQHLAALSQEEGLAPETITSAIEAGSMVLLGNPAHAGLAPIVVGQPSRIKVNANIGTSPLCNCLHTEKRKLAVALEAGADTVMDLSIAGHPYRHAGCLPAPAGHGAHVFRGPADPGQ